MSILQLWGVLAELLTITWLKLYNLRLDLRKIMILMMLSFHLGTWQSLLQVFNSKVLVYVPTALAFEHETTMDVLNILKVYFYNSYFFFLVLCLSPIESHNLKPFPWPAWPVSLEMRWPSSTGFCICIIFFRLPVGLCQKVVAHICIHIHNFLCLC